MLTIPPKQNQGITLINNRTLNTGEKCRLCECFWVAYAGMKDLFAD